MVDTNYTIKHCHCCISNQLIPAPIFHPGGCLCNGCNLPYDKRIKNISSIGEKFNPLVHDYYHPDKCRCNKCLNKLNNDQTYNISDERLYFLAKTSPF